MSILKELFLFGAKESLRINQKMFLKNRSWVTFHCDIGIEKFIFKDQAELILLTNHGVGKGRWEYIPQDQSLLIEYENKTLLFSSLFINEHVICLMDQFSEDLFFLTSTEVLLNQKMKEKIMSFLYKQLSIRTATLDSGQKLEILGVNDKKYTSDDYLIGKEVTINLKKPKDGVYSRNRGTVNFYIQDGRITQIRNSLKP